MHSCQLQAGETILQLKYNIKCFPFSKKRLKKLLSYAAPITTDIILEQIVSPVDCRILTREKCPKQTYTLLCKYYKTSQENKRKR